MIEIRFDHKLVDINFNKKELNFLFYKGNGVSEDITVKADKVIAADGVNSRVREAMLGLDDFVT